MNRFPLFGVALAALIAAGCSGPAVGETDIAKPTHFHFQDVNDALGYNCGTLDCHGQPGRNLRIWSKYGMRITDGRHVPGGRADTSGAEADLTYRSVVGLEPGIMSQVVQDKGKHPERLTMIRKARGTEAHKGLKRMSAGDPLDVCITSWLAGNVAYNSCKAAESPPPPP